MSLTRYYFPDGLTLDAIEAIEAEVMRDLAANNTEPTTALRTGARFRRHLDFEAAAELDNVRLLRPRATPTTFVDTEAEAA